MRYEVPQFIDVEDKILGPFTFRQFIYVAGAGGFVLMLYLSFPFIFVIIFGAPVAALAAALAFYKVNNRPFIVMLESMVRYTTTQKLYLWKKVEKKKEIQKTPEEEAALKLTPKISQNKLKDLAWSLDIKESLYTDEKQR